MKVASVEEKRSRSTSRGRTEAARSEPRSKRLRGLEIPEKGSAQIEVEGKAVKLTNLHKPFWPELGITKGDLIRYYAGVSSYLLPHLEAGPW